MNLMIQPNQICLIVKLYNNRPELLPDSNDSGYRIKMDDEAKLVIFCQIATQYLDELQVGDEYRQHEEIEYPIIYPLTSNI